jgi:aldehyde:ferredoxin oxidoreductase
METTTRSGLFGWKGTILYVDLSTSEIREEELSTELRENYIGGAGINAKLLYDQLHDKPEADPLGPENAVIFGVGVLAGTTFPCTSRMTITSKSPVTGIFGDSNGGGWFPARLKHAGYDHVVITGKSQKPVALFIEQGKKPEIVDATDLWGLDTFETDAAIQAKYGPCEAARIGPAAENLVRYANVFTSTKRTGVHGKTGMGCVMGAKKLKAVIVKADGSVPVADEEKFKELGRFYGEKWAGNATYGLQEYGSFSLIPQNSMHTRIHNQQTHITSEQLEAYDVENLVKNYKTGRTSCYRCPVACTQQFEVTDGPYKGEKIGKVEFGHYTNMGPLIGIFDYPQLFHISNIANRMGFDCITFGWIVAMAMECFQRGIITIKDTGGVELKWGDIELVTDLIKKIAYREGIGNLLADSMPMILEKLPPEAREYGFHTKGLSFSYNCEQGIAMSLASSVATRGADHLKGHPFAAMIGLEDMLKRVFGDNLPEGMLDGTNPTAKGRVVWWSENYKSLMDSLGICFIPVVAVDVFGDPIMLFEELGEIYQAATGGNPDKLFEAAERIYQLEKSFNALLGITRKDDIRQGTRRGQKDPIYHPGMLQEYYHYRGCSQDGLPTRKRLEEVGLSDVAKDLTKKKKISEYECPAITELLPKGVGS